ncbi:serine/threonine-protein kinase Sgk2 [Penicillium taxi]|uniref:serine/threonine-protein kinase Sgk2 n=1 Tax=Penicillium taxi TaxID=168475 RepID=UPI002545B293|nr:serine/threonine-protein kinase Sgk2 [Penicillium taxi]KAJ5885541.1 serine/threonine-protein kinase Sgk2 [Penicillium taxi]
MTVCDSDGCPLLIVAIINKADLILDLLLETSTVNIDTQDATRRTALITAAIDWGEAVPKLLAKCDRSKPNLYVQNREDPYENRVLSCLIIFPAGRVVSDFGSVRELLEAFHDAIRAHLSLFVKGSILHRDISSNNIIITDPSKSGGFQGILIDLDLAKERDSGPSGALHQTGTMQFMAIEVLRGTEHTYCHDLESFFYVMLWMCARCAWKSFCGSDETEPIDSILCKWEIGSFKDIANAKEGHMTVNVLKRIMSEFPKALEMVKPLCLSIRPVLFGDTAELITGTPSGEPDRLYSAIIDACSEAIEHL